MSRMGRAVPLIPSDRSPHSGAAASSQCTAPWSERFRGREGTGSSRLHHPLMAQSCAAALEIPLPSRNRRLPSPCLHIRTYRDDGRRSEPVRLRTTVTLPSYRKRTRCPAQARGAPMLSGSSHRQSCSSAQARSMCVSAKLRASDRKYSTTLLLRPAYQAHWDANTLPRTYCCVLEHSIDVHFFCNLVLNGQDRISPEKSLRVRFRL